MNPRLDVDRPLAISEYLTLSPHFAHGGRKGPLMATLHGETRSLC